MKDKKSIAIVVLAALVAGVGIFSVVNKQSQDDENAGLKNEIAAETKEKAKVADDYRAVKEARDLLGDETLQLKNDLTVAEQSVQKLTAEKTAIEVNLKDNDLKHVEELGRKNDEIARNAEDLEKVKGELVAKTEELDQISKDLIGAEADVEREKKALVDLKTQTNLAIEEGKKIITNLESQNDALNQAKGALENKIENLDGEIVETKKKLEVSEGDRVFLERELLRLQDEKAELVKKMNDIEFITAQYKRIKSDINVARRLDWMRRGIGIYAKPTIIAEKFAELRKPNVVAKSAGTNEALPEKIQVELTSDGEVRINGKIVESKVEESPEQPETSTPVSPTPAPVPNQE